MFTIGLLVLGLALCLTLRVAQQFRARFISPGNSIDHTPGSAVAAGDVVLTGSNLIGIAQNPIAAGVPGALAVQGIFDVVKDSSAFTAGDAVYWDADGSPVGGTALSGASTSTSSGNTFMGFALADAGAGVAVVRVLLIRPTTLTVQTDLANVIADPGNTDKAIPVTASGTCSLVSTGSDTRTLAAPTFAGQQLQLTHKTDGGSVVITCATTVNQTGNNTITMSAAGDSILLVARYIGTNLRWSAVYVDGAALSTV